MKRTLLLLLVAFVSCKKNSNQAASNASASFQYYSSRTALNSSLNISGNAYGTALDCTYHTASPNAGYLFEFIQTLSGVGSGVHFAIPEINVGQQLSYKYNPRSSLDLSGDCVLFDGTSDIVMGTDSAYLTVTISRYSNETMDGTFSMQIWDQGSVSATITNGSFTNIPLVKF